MADNLKRAMLGAHKRGMKLAPLHHTDRLADIFCATCGWPKTPRETVIEKYANEPYGCPRCAMRAEDAPTRPGHAKPQERGK